MTSAFNPETFLGTEYEQANDTRLPLVPECEVNAQISKLKIRSGVSKDTQEPWNMLDVFWELLDQSIADQLEMKKVTVPMSLFLDVSENGSLDMGKGKNVGLGRLREALKMNEPGKRFALRQLQGAIGKVKVEHDTINDGPSKGELKAIIRKVTAV